MISPRIANTIIGLALLENISESDIISFSDEFDIDNIIHFGFTNGCEGCVTV